MSLAQCQWHFTLLFNIENLKILIVYVTCPLTNFKDFSSEENSLLTLIIVVIQFCTQHDDLFELAETENETETETQNRHVKNL